MTRTQLDKIDFSYARFNPLTYDQIEPSEIYLSKPGHKYNRVIGKLNGVDESSCQLNIKLNNTATLEFTVNRIVDDEISTFYDLIERHYELYLTHFGWFKINEEPELNNDGNIETKIVRAESLEIELQQFDKVNFEINTGSVSSAEMMATDNTYEIGEYMLPRDNVKFWRDTSALEELIEVFPVDGSAQQLITMMQSYPCLRNCWRVQFDLDDFDEALQSAISEYRTHGYDTTYLESLVGNIKDQLSAWQLAKGYPIIWDYVTVIDIDTKNYDYNEDVDDPEDAEYTVHEVLELELKRQKDLSFLDVVLEETGWTVGFVDPSYNLASDDESERQPLADKVGKFQVDTQDVYSFLTQEAAQYFKCIFDFDTENYTVNAYKVETLGVDTNIFLSFHNIQNSVTRSSDRDLHTVYSVSNGTDDNRLDIREANIGNIEVEDLSYFMNTKHFSKEIIDKYNDWLTVRESKRQEYMDLSVRWRDENDKLTEIYDRVPVDGVNGQQYSSMTVEQLEAENENYKALIRGLEALYVDDNNVFDIEKLKASSDWPTYKMVDEVVLSKARDTLMIVEPSAEWDALTKQLDDDQAQVDEYTEQYKQLGYEIQKLTDELSELNTTLLAKYTRIAELEDIDEPTEEQLAELEQLKADVEVMQSDCDAKTEQLNSKQDEQDDIQDEIDAVSPDIDADVAAIREYYEDNTYEGIIDDDTIRTVSMYYIRNYEGYHLGVIDTELFNRWQIQHYTTAEGESGLEKVKFDEEYIYNLDKYGDSYGLAELNTLLKTLYNKVYTEAQYKDVDMATADEFHKEHKELYDKYEKAYKKCQELVDKRQQEYDEQKELLDSIQRQRDNITDYVNNWEWTDKEKWLLQRYRIHTDYVNENIVVTDINTNKQIVDQSYELYKDALEELYADSHPQWNFNTTQDNLLMMPELQDWHGQLEIGNFIRVGFREDDPKEVITLTDITGYRTRICGYGEFDQETFVPTITGRSGVIYLVSQHDVNMAGYAVVGQTSIVDSADTGTMSDGFTKFIYDGNGFVKIYDQDSASTNYFSLYPNFAKLRLIGITLNPFMNEPSIDLEFSNMIKYKSKRNDFVQLLGLNGGSGKNQISASYASHAGTADTVNITTDLIMKLVNNPSFGPAAAGSIGGLIGSGGYITDALNGMSISVDQVADLKTRLSDLVNGYVDANVISTKLLQADDVVVNNQLSAKFVTADSLEAQSAKIAELSAGAVTADSVVAALVSAQTGAFDELTSNSAFIQHLNSGIIDTGVITAETLVATMANITSAQIEQLSADSAFMQYLEANLIVASEIQVDDLKAKLAQVDTLTAGSAFVNYLQGLSSTVATSVITDAYIYNAVAGHISVADLDTHTATAQEIVLISADGTNPAIAFSGATQQFYDDDGNVRVQIGQDGNGDFNFIVRGSDGSTALFDSNGITQNGIPNSTIVNNMITDGTIQKAKMGFNIATANADGTINITDVKDGSGGNFGVSYTTFTQNTNSAIGNLSDDIDEINNKKMYRVVVQSNNGNIFKNGDVNCTLSCHVYSWDDDITNDINAANFVWTRKSNDTVGDTTWNANHSGGAKTITLTPADVYGRSVFYCTVTLPDGSSISSG